MSRGAGQTVFAMRIDKNAPVPIARQIERAIGDLIASGEFSPGQRLPTEMDLCNRLGVSRTPIRQALGQLVAQGLLVRQAGRGTFVALNGAPATNANATEDVTVTVPEQRWCWPLQQAALSWNARHPDRQVRLRFKMVGQAELRGRLMHAVAQGRATDLALLDSVWVAEFAERGYLQPLASINPTVTSALTADIVAPLLAEHTVHGELVALPADADFALLWYRKDWFAAEGLAPPRTWDELLICARHFQSAEVRDRYALDLYPLSFAGGSVAGETTAYQLLPILWSAGADVIANHQVVLNSRATRSAVTFIANLVQKHGIAPRSVVTATWNDPPLALAAGTAAMSFGGSYESALIRAAAGWDEAGFNSRVGFVPIPAGPGGSQATLLGGLSYGIFRQSQQPELALGLLERAFAPDILRVFCAQTGQNPPTVSATRALAAETEPFLHATAQLLPHARSRWPIAEYARVSAQLVRMFESAILGEASPEEAVARAAAIIAGITGLPERTRHRPSAWPAA
jgi:ABC-type glycerol-3-phosphate transport system substrate-binding protein